jgi:copper chaperone CopZ
VLACLASLAHADERVTIGNVHRCCRSCTAGINEAVGGVAGVTATVMSDKIGLSGPTTDDLQRAVDALCAAGYSGTSDNPAVKVNAGAGPDETLTALTVSGTHLCCSGCTGAAKGAIKVVPGVKSDTIAIGARSFTVEGEFNGKALMEALARAGLNGTATK